MKQLKIFHTFPVEKQNNILIGFRLLCKEVGCVLLKFYFKAMLYEFYEAYTGLCIRTYLFNVLSVSMKTIKDEFLIFTIYLISGYVSCDFSQIWMSLLTMNKRVWILGMQV
jgi:hypothetical protein